MQIGQHRELLRLRVRRLERGLLVALGLLGVSYFYLQVVRGAHYLELAENNRLRRTALEAPRGTITDRTGRVLVENLPSYALEVDPGATGDLSASLRFAAGILGRPVAELEALLARERRRSGPGPLLLGENLSLPQVARFRVARLEHPEFGIEVRQRRFYRLGSQGAHVLGYLGEVSASELAARPADLRAGEWIGRRGIERAYDDRLRGQNGERVMVVDHRGVPIREYGRVLGRPGAGLRLTLDADLQQEAERLLEGQVGAIVALDPRDGAIRAMVSAPAYDPNLFARRLAGDDWKALVEDERKPLQNRALQSVYSPGSVFKVVMGAAALAEGVVTPSTRVYCPGFATHYGRRFHCWKRGGHGNVDLEEAILHSCDVYFYEVGERLGIERIAKWARRFGLGEPTGVDVAGERSGLVPDDAWSQKARGHRWYPGETISVAIGQSALLTTPIQMARMFAAFANGGQLVEPHLVEGGGSPPRPVEALPAGVLAPVRSGLWRVVNEDGGTARGARVPGLRVAGKTGTVQVVTQEAYSDSSKELPWKLRNHAWFAAYAPAERPELVVVVFVEHGGKGSAAAAPLARALYESSSERIAKLSLPLPEVPRRLGELGRLHWGLPIAALALTAIGLFTVRSAASEVGGDYFARQLVWVGAGLLGMLLAFSIDYQRLLAWSVPLYAGGLAALLLVLPFGYRAGGAVGWFRIGSVGVQPSEFTKLATALVLARFLAGESDRHLDLRQIGGVLAIAATPMLLIALEPDLGGAAMFVPMVAGVLLTGGVRFKWIAIAALVGLVGVAGVWTFGMKEYQRDRVRTFVQPERDPLGAGYQVRQSKIAVGSGQIGGRGYRQGTQSQLRFLPARHTDFILAVLAEEHGFVGVGAILLLYGLYFGSATAVALRAQDRAGILLVVSVVAMGAFHVVYNAAMVIGLVPITGIPLPFLSYGGSFTVVNWVIVGLVLNVDFRRYANR